MSVPAAPAQATERAPGVFEALPRRPARRWTTRAGPALRVDRMRLPTASAPRVMVRAAVWTLEGVRLAVVLLGDRLAGRLNPRQVGVRVRESFERLGGTAVKLGQQLSIRVDMLPREVCEELARLTDSGRPFPVAVARAALEEAAGVPVDVLLEELDEHPIGAASIACVWRGRLRGGEEVAIKVQRPAVEAQFAADLGAFAWMTRVMEALALVRPGFFANLRGELRSIFLSELDFRAEARFQRLFRRYARAWGLDWVSAPRVHPALSGRRVMVSEFVRGVACQKLLDLAEAGTPEAQARLQELDIDPVLVGERILQLAYWGNEDAPFFHADPHPGNLLVLPGSRIVLLDFGAVGSMDGTSVRTLAGVLGALATGRPALGADYAVVRMGPYPHIEVEDFRGEAREIFRRFHLALEDPKAPWTERTTAALWVGFLEGVQRYGITVNVNTVQSMRASLLYDSLAARLKPTMGLEVFRAYQLRAARRRAELSAEQGQGRRSPDAAPAALAQLRRLSRDLQQLELGLAQVSANPAVRLVETLERGLRAAQSGLRVLATGWVVVLAVGLVVGLGPPTQVGDWEAWIRAALAPWPVRVVLAVLVLLTARRIRFDLEPLRR